MLQLSTDTFQLKIYITIVFFKRIQKYFYDNDHKGQLFHKKKQSLSFF